MKRMVQTKKPTRKIIEKSKEMTFSLIVEVFRDEKLSVDYGLKLNRFYLRNYYFYIKIKMMFGGSFVSGVSNADLEKQFSDKK